ncbi:MAG: ABC transporter substrate-binding protein [Opitutales bacterium]
MRSVSLILLTILLCLNPRAQAEIRVTDLRGKEIVLAQPAQRIILGEGRFLAALGVLDDAPLGRVAGMMGEFKRYDPDSFAQWAAHFPELPEVPLIGAASADTVSLEKIISLRPDLAVFGLSGHGPTAEAERVLQVLEKAGIPVACIDFRDQPIRNTPRSIRVLGALLGQSERAEAFAQFYEEALAEVLEPLAAAEVDAPSVFLHSHVGLSDGEWRSMGDALMGRFISTAGGDNIATSILPGPAGTISSEFLFSHQPDLYIGTSIGAAAYRERFPARIILGAGVSPAMAQASFRRATEGKRVGQLQAVREGRAFAIWHHFYNSPLNIAAVQAMAKWLHPELFAELDPEATLAELFERFQPVDLDGTYWIQLSVTEETPAP